MEFAFGMLLLQQMEESRVMLQHHVQGWKSRNLWILWHLPPDPKGLVFHLSSDPRWPVGREGHLARSLSKHETFMSSPTTRPEGAVDDVNPADGSHRPNRWTRKGTRVSLETPGRPPTPRTPVLAFAGVQMKTRTVRHLNLLSCSCSLGIKGLHIFLVFLGKAS